MPTLHFLYKHLLVLQRWGHRKPIAVGKDYSPRLPSCQGHHDCGLSPPSCILPYQAVDPPQLSCHPVVPKRLRTPSHRENEPREWRVDLPASFFAKRQFLQALSSQLWVAAWRLRHNPHALLCRYRQVVDFWNRSLCHSFGAACGPTTTKQRNCSWQTTLSVNLQSARSGT